MGAFKRLASSRSPGAASGEERSKYQEAAEELFSGLRNKAEGRYVLKSSLQFSEKLVPVAPSHCKFGIYLLL